MRGNVKTLCAHNNSADVDHSFHMPANSQEATFACLLAKNYLDDMGCCCSVVCFCFGCWCFLEDMFQSKLPSGLDALPSGRQMEM